MDNIFVVYEKNKLIISISPRTTHYQRKAKEFFFGIS